MARKTFNCYCRGLYNSDNIINFGTILLWNLRGAAYYELGQFDDAINCYKIVLKSIKDPNGQVFYNLGVIYEKKQDLETSLTYFRNALSNSSYKPNIYVNIGNIFRAKDNFSGISNNMETHQA